MEESYSRENVKHIAPLPIIAVMYSGMFAQKNKTVNIIYIPKAMGIRTVAQQKEIDNKDKLIIDLKGSQNHQPKVMAGIVK